jgi:hypothetical protein
MDRSTIRWITLVAGVVLSALGAIWALQGLGIVGGSAMSGEDQWLTIGAIVGAIGVALLYRALTTRP